MRKAAWTRCNRLPRSKRKRHGRSGTKSKNFSLSVSAIQTFLARYPNSSLAPQRKASWGTFNRLPSSKRRRHGRSGTRSKTRTIRPLCSHSSRVTRIRRSHRLRKPAWRPFNKSPRDKRKRHGLSAKPLKGARRESGIRSRTRAIRRHYWHLSRTILAHCSCRLRKSAWRFSPRSKRKRHERTGTDQDFERSGRFAVVPRALPEFVVRAPSPKPLGDASTGCQEAGGKGACGVGEAPGLQRQTALQSFIARYRFRLRSIAQTFRKPSTDRHGERGKGTCRVE